MKVFVSCALIALLLAVTHVRNAIWADDGLLWNDIIEKAPRKARAYNEYGLHVLDAGQYDLALRLLGKSLELNRYQPQVYVNVGLAYERKQEIEKAIAAYERAIFVQPDDPVAFYNLGGVYYRLGQREKALSYFLKARDLDPKEPDVHQFLGFIYREAGDLPRAAQELTLYEQLRHR